MCCRTKSRQTFDLCDKEQKSEGICKSDKEDEGHYCTAKKIHIVLDNLNTHVKKSLLDFYDDKEGESYGVDLSGIIHRSMRVG